jgi:hypothetical protein
MEPSIVCVPERADAVPARLGAREFKRRAPARPRRGRFGGCLMARNIWISTGLVMSVMAAFGLFWLVGNYAEARFTESSFKSRFPEKTFRYDADKLRRLASSDVRKIYVVPLLFPLDLLVMLALAGSMGAAI